MKKIAIGLLLFTLAGAVGGGYAWWSQQRKGPDVTYRFGAVERGDLTAAVSATGKLTPVVVVQVGSQVSGQVKEIFVDYNSRVTKGQLIARIDPASFALRVDQAEGDLNAAQAGVLTQKAQLAALRAEVSRQKVNLKEAERELKRNQMLFERGFVSEGVRDKAEAGVESGRELVKAAEAQLAVGELQVNSGEAAVRQRQAQLAQARVELERTRIFAPVDGIVVQKSVEPGQTVAASLQAPDLFLIAQDLRKMKVLASVDEAEVGKVRIGQPVKFTVDAFPGRTYQGTVSQIRKAAVTLQNVVTYTAEVETSNPDLSLYPGMTANLRIVIEHRENVLKLPVAALRFRPADRAAESGKKTSASVKVERTLVAASGTTPPLPKPASGGNPARVWVVGPDGHLQAINIRIGLTDGNYAEVVDGELQDGAEVIIGTAGTAPGAAKPKAAPVF